MVKATAQATDDSTRRTTNAPKVGESDMPMDRRQAELLLESSSVRLPNLSPMAADSSAPIMHPAGKAEAKMPDCTVVAPSSRATPSKM